MPLPLPSSTSRLLLFHSGGLILPKRMMGTVRVIARCDWDNGKAYTDDVMEVRAGYARNYLVPRKMAVYATRENFLRFGIADPDHETEEQRQKRLAKEASKDDIDQKAHDLLRKYFRNKTVRVDRDNVLLLNCEVSTMTKLNEFSFVAEDLAESRSTTTGNDLPRCGYST